jgi:hypothetical protein
MDVANSFIWSHFQAGLVFVEQRGHTRSFGTSPRVSQRYIQSALCRQRLRLRGHTDRPHGDAAETARAAFAAPCATRLGVLNQCW